MSKRNAFDEKVRTWLKHNYHVQFCELTNRKDNLIMHEIFGGAYRHASIYVDYCTFILTENIHNNLHSVNSFSKEGLTIRLIKNRLNRCYPMNVFDTDFITELIEQLRRAVEIISLKEYRRKWKEFFRHDGKLPLYQVDLLNQIDDRR